MVNWKKYLGVFIIAAAWLCWILIPAFALLNLSVEHFALITGVLLVLSEILTYVGTILLGKELWGQLKAHASLGRVLKTITAKLHLKYRARK